MQLGGPAGTIGRDAFQERRWGYGGDQARAASNHDMASVGRVAPRASRQQARGPSRDADLSRSAARTPQTYGQGGFGVTLSEMSDSNELIGNFINNTGVDGYGVYVSDDSLANIIGASTIISLDHAIYLEEDILTLHVRNSTINSTSDYSLRSEDTDIGSWVNFTNVTFNSTVLIAKELNLTVNWFLDVNVSDTVGNGITDNNQYQLA